jgi:ABC-type multidrug transport system fused ATPase/permease subunit
LYSVRWQAALAGALMAINPLIAVLLLWLMKYLIDEVFVGKNVGVLPVVASAYTILVATKLGIDYLLTRIEAAIAEQIDQNVRVDVYRHLVSVSPGSLGKFSVGDLISHLGADVSRVEGLIYGGPVRVIFSTLTAVYFIGFLIVLSWKLTLAALITAPILALLSWRWSPYVRRVARISRRKATAWISRAEERLGATAVIIAFGAHSIETQAGPVPSIAALRSIALQAWLTLVTEAVAATGGFVVLAVGAYEMYSDALTVGTLIAFLGSVGSLYSPISSLARSPGRFQRSAVGAQRIVELLDAPSLVTERHDAIPLTAVRGVLEFFGVCFAYPSGPEALRGVSFRIDAGETVAVVGPNGSGKTTLVQLALRLYDPSEGLVSIDGMDLRGVTLESLRRSVAVVFQEPSVLRGNISETIRYGQPDASNEMFISTAKAAHVHEFATGLPRGYGTPIGPRGSWLSGGQRQRLALARALLRDSPILLLDEATASIDSEAEQLIQEAVSRFRGKRTIMVVSHRLSTVLRADRIVVLENGRIVEIGAPAALQGSASRFRTLFADQFLTEKVSA